MAKAKTIDGSIELGDRVADKITGFKGIASGESRFLAQCRQILVRPETLDKDGKRIDPEWIDEGQLDILEKSVHKPFLTRAQEALEVVGALAAAPVRAARTGGESSHPREARR